MEDEIKKLIANNPGYIETIEQCWDVVQTFINDAKNQFADLLNELLPEHIIYSYRGQLVCLYSFWIDFLLMLYFSRQIGKG